MKTYETSRDYELLVELLDSGATVIYRYTGKRWSQFTATRTGKTVSYQGHGKESFIELCRRQGREFIVPTVERPEPLTGEQKTALMVPGCHVKYLPSGRIGTVTDREADRIAVRWTDGCSSPNLPARQFAPMELRWWNFDTAPAMVKAVRRDGMETILCFEPDEDMTWRFRDIRTKEKLNAREVAEEYVQTNGMPCGTLEVVE